MNFELLIHYSDIHGTGGTISMQGRIQNWVNFPWNTPTFN